MSEEQESQGKQQAKPYQVMVFQHGDDLVAIPVMHAYGQHASRYRSDEGRSAMVYPSLDAYHQHVLDRDRDTIIASALKKLDRNEVEVLGLTQQARSFGL